MLLHREMWVVHINGIWLLELLVFITVITSLFSDGGSYYNRQDYAKGHDVYVESVALN